MRITILLLIVGLCIVSAKYLPYENESAALLRNKRSNSEESSPSAENNDSKNNNDDDDDDDDDDSSKEQALNKEKRKEEEQRRKLEEKLAKEQRKQDQKREKEERKRLERIEKEKRKEEEKHKKLLEKAAKEEKKRQEKQRKEIEKLEKEALGPQSNEDSFLETEEENSVELGGIWRNHIYMKYGLTLASTSAEKKAALDRYLKEELSLSSNSTQAERQQAIVKLIKTRLQNDTAAKEAIRNQLLSQINSVTINKLQNKLNNNIEKLNNKTEILNNITLPWAKVAQQNLEEKKTFLQSISEFLSNVLPNWIPNAPKDNTNSSLNQIVPINANGIPLSKEGVLADKNIESSQPSELIPSGIVDSSLPDLVSNVAAENAIVINQNLGISNNKSDATNSSPVSTAIANNNSLKSNSSDVSSGISDVASNNSDISTPNSPSVISVSPVSTIDQNGDVSNVIASNSNPNENSATQNIGVEPSNKDNSIASVLGNVKNIFNNLDKVNDSSVVPSGQLPNSSVGTKKDSNVISQTVSDIVQTGISNVLSSNSVNISETGVVSKEVSVTKNVSEGPANKEVSITSVFDNIDSIVNNVDKIVEATIAPSIKVHASVSSGQQSNNDSVVSINNSNISSVGTTGDSNIVSQSAGVQPSASSVSSLNSVNTPESGIISTKISVNKNVSEGPANKKISIVSVLEGIDSVVNNVDKVIEATIAPSLNIDASISNGQLSNNENSSSINNSNILSVNSSAGTKLEGNIISQSVTDIVPTNIHNESTSYSVLITKSGVISKEVNVIKNLSEGPINKDVSITSVIDSIDNIFNNADKVVEATIVPSIKVDVSVSSGQQSNNDSVVSIKNVNISSVGTKGDSNIASQSASIQPSASSVSSLNSISTPESGIISTKISVNKNVSEGPANKKISIVSVLEGIDSVVNNVDKVIEATIAPSLNIDASISNGQLSNNENSSSINDSNILSVNSSAGTKLEGNIVSQSVTDIVPTNINNESTSNSVLITKSGVISKEVNVNKNLSEGPVNKDVSITSVIDSIDNIINNADKVVEATIVPSIKVDASVSSGQQSNNDSVVSIKNVNISSVGTKGDSNIVSQSASVQPSASSVSLLSSLNISESGIISNEINVNKNVSELPANKEISIASVLDSIDSVVNNVDKGIEATIAPSLNIDASVSSGQLSNKNLVSINDSNILSAAINNDTKIVSESTSNIVQPNVSSVDAISSPIRVNKNINTEQAKEVSIASSILDSIVSIFSSDNNVTESTVAPSINIDASLSSGQAPEPKNNSTINISKVIQTAESGVITKNINVTKDVGAKSANKEITIDSNVLGSIDNVINGVDQISESTVAPSSGPLANNKNISTVSINEIGMSSVNISIEANKNSNVTSKSVNDIVQTSLSGVSSSNNVQSSVSASESSALSNQGSKSNNSSKINDKSAVGLDIALNNKINSSGNVETSNDINKTSDVILAASPVNSVSFNKSSVDVVASSDSKIAVDSSRNISTSKVVNDVSLQNNSVSVESKLDNINNGVKANSNNESISESSANIKSSLNNNTVSIVSQIIASLSSNVTLPVNDVTTSDPSIAGSTYDAISSVSSQSNISDSSSAVSVIDIATSSPVQSNVSNPIKIETVQIINNENVTKSSNVSDILPSKNSSSSVKNASLVGNDTSVSNVEVTNAANIPSAVSSVNISNDSTTIIDVSTTDSSIGKEILPKTNVNESNITVASSPVVIADSTTIALSPEVSTVVPSSADLISNSSKNISETVKVADNSSAVVVKENILKIVSNNLTSAQKVANKSDINVGTEASTEPALTESIIIDLGAPSTLSDIASNVNTAPSNLATESSLFDVGSTAQTDISQSLSTVVPAEPSTIAVDGVTLPAEPGASVVEILPQV